MALTMKQILRRHGAFVSAVTAAAVGVAIAVLRVAQDLIWYPVYLAASAPAQAQAPNLVGTFITAPLLAALPFTIGFFLSLWIVAPVAEELRVGHVISRSILATGIGATVTFIVQAVVAIVSGLAFAGSLFGQAFPTASFNAPQAVQGLASAFPSSLNTFVSLLPLGVLAGILLWIWRKDHPPRHPLSGLIDEV